MKQPKFEMWEEVEFTVKGFLEKIPFETTQTGYILKIMFVREDSVVQKKGRGYCYKIVDRIPEAEDILPFAWCIARKEDKLSKIVH